MGTLRQHFEKLWSGEHTTRERGHHPFHPLDVIEEVGSGVAFYKGFVNQAVVVTEDGAVLLDTGSFHPVAQERHFASIRTYTKTRIHTALYTHGHADHAYGLPPFLKEAKARGWARPAVIGHEAVAPRLQRYVDTAGYNAIINTRQFGAEVEWPVDPVYPSITYRDELHIAVGGRRIQLYHAKGETDDHTLSFVPDARVLYTGDLFIWAAPNAGNPQKVQRFVVEWSAALRRMAALKPVVLCPGHGLPIFGEQEGATALFETAEYLESLHQQTLELLNSGATIYDVVHTVRPPAHLTERPYLLPVYDEPEFIARNLYRRYAGWYSGVPCELKPAEPARQALEIVALAGGLPPLLARARTLLTEGDLRLASHLVDWAVQAEPHDLDAHALRAEVYEARTEAEPSTMSKGIYGAAATHSRAACGEP